MGYSPKDTTRTLYIHGQLALKLLEHRVCPISIRYGVTLVHSSLLLMFRTIGVKSLSRILLSFRFPTIKTEPLLFPGKSFVFANGL